MMQNAESKTTHDNKSTAAATITTNLYDRDNDSEYVGKYGVDGI
jgi:hypothetical protein